MNWKVILTVLVILALAGLALSSESGPQSLNFLKNRLSGLVSGILKTGETFLITLSADKESFYGQIYDLTNSTFASSAVYENIKIDGKGLSLISGKRMDIVVGNMNGKFEITNAGSVVISAYSNHVEVGDVVFESAKGMKVDAELVPTEFSLSDLNQNRINLASVNGELRKLNADGSTNLVKFLNFEKLTIDGLSGRMQMKNNNVELSGSAGSVSGQDFKWVE